MASKPPERDSDSSVGKPTNKPEFDALQLMQSANPDLIGKPILPEYHAAQHAIDKHIGTPEMVDSSSDRSLDDHVKKQPDGSTIHTNDKGQVTEVDRADGSVVKIKYGRDGNPSVIDEDYPGGVHYHYEKTKGVPGDPFKSEWRITSSMDGKTVEYSKGQSAMFITKDGEMHIYRRNKDGSWSEQMRNSDGSEEQGDGIPPGVKPKWPKPGEHSGPY